MPEVEIDPEQAALLLIDMQNDFLHEKGKFAASGIGVVTTSDELAIE